MTIGWVDSTFTSIGTGTTETRINRDADLELPSDTNGIVEIIPYLMELGAFTVDQALLVAMRAVSPDFSIEPKRWVLPSVNTGDAAFASVQAPALMATPMNIKCGGNQRLRLLGEALVANTVAPGVGATVVVTDGGVGREWFYDRPDAETAGGTTIDTRTAGGSITITSGKLLKCVCANVSNGVATASEHDVGFMEFESSGFDKAFPVQVAVAPSAAGLGAAAGQPSNPAGMSKWVYPDGHEMPIKERTIINTFYTNRDARTGASNFIGSVGFYK